MATILVADDNSNIQKMVSLVFEEKGISVVAVGNGEAACRKVPEVKPDIVLADVFMPVRNGYEVCEFVKRDSRFSETPVILLVGAFDPLDEKEAQRVGADGVLKKPFVPPDPLISLVDSLLQKMEKQEEKQVAPPAPVVPPPIVVAPPPPVVPPPVSVEVEPEPEEDEVSYGAAGRDSDMAEEINATGTGPVAVPSSHNASEVDEEEEESSATASDWKRRREAMDYEIPTEESANLVEDLAGTAPASDKPAEEQTVAEKSSSAVPETKIDEGVAPEHVEALPQTSPSEWMDYMAAADPKTAPPAQAEVPEPAAPVPEPEPVSYSAASSEIESPSVEPVHADSHAESLLESPAETLARGSNFTPTPVESHAESHSESPEPAPEVIPFPVHAELVVNPEPELDPAESHPVPGFSALEPISVEEPAPVSQSAVERVVQEVIAEPKSGNQSQMDQATIDSIVAKVVEKLEPQLHQALSQGVLKPLIQELLKGELKPDK